MLHRLFRRADAILFCSSYLQAAAKPFLTGIPTDTYVGVVGDGFDPDELAAAAGRPFEYPTRYLLGMGRLVKKKGFDLLIKAFARVAAEFPDLHLLIAGDGEEKRPLGECIQALGLEDRVRLLGFADRKTAMALFLGCEFFVLSSRIEPFGIVVLEAMAAGKPVLATRSGGVVDLIQPGVNGWLAEPEVDSLAREMRRMLIRAEETRAMGKRAAETIRAHTWLAVTEQFLDVFDRVLNSKA
jgi:glycogen(starch) synthase